MISVREKYPAITKEAFVVSMQFSAPYLSEVAFSSLTDIEYNKGGN